MKLFYCPKVESMEWNTKCMGWTQDNDQGGKGRTNRTDLGQWCEKNEWYSVTASYPDQLISYSCVYVLPSRQSNAVLPVPESKCTDELKWHQNSSDTDHSSLIIAPSISFTLRSSWYFFLKNWCQLLAHMSYHYFNSYDTSGDHWINSSSCCSLSRKISPCLCDIVV